MFSSRTFGTTVVRIIVSVLTFFKNINAFTKKKKMGEAKRHITDISETNKAICVAAAIVSHVLLSTAISLQIFSPH